jgi:hypothetical protein
MNKSQKLEFVKKRDGRLQKIDLSKIETRIAQLCDGLDMDHISPVSATFIGVELS